MPPYTLRINKKEKKSIDGLIKKDDASHAMKNIVWNEAHTSIPNYLALYNFVAARAGEGEIVTRESLGLITRHFTFPTLYKMEIPSGAFVIYSMDQQTGELDVELIS